MQGDREVRGNSNAPLDSGFGFDRGVFPSVFGTGKDPFDDPFFTRPFGTMFRSNTFSYDGPSSLHHTRPPFGRMFRSNTFSYDGPSSTRPRGPVIEEVDSDEEEAKLEENDIAEADWRNTNPEDHVNDHGNSSSNGRDISYFTNRDKPEANQRQTRRVTYQRVTYGGISGPYYTETTSRRTGNDGVTVEESRKADRTTGRATHRVSRGLHDKGHSVTRKLDSDGKVDTVQTLHNLNEDEFGGFEQAWRSNGDRLLHDWNDAFDFPGNSGSGSGRQQGGGLSSWAGHNVDRNLEPSLQGGGPKGCHD